MQVSKLFLPEVQEAVERGDWNSLKTVFEHLHPSDLAEIVSQLTPHQVADIIRKLRGPRSIEVFAQLEIEQQADVMALLGRQEAVKILEELSPDDRVDLLQTVPEEQCESILPLMAQAEREEVRKLLQYGENTAGALMTTEYAYLPVDVTVGEAFTRLRAVAPDSETIYYIYVTDTDRRLIGTVSLRDLVVARQNQKIGDIMRKDLIFVDSETDQEEVARELAKYDLLAIPVVDKERKLVGIITHDDILDVLVEEQTEDVHRLGAVEPVEEPYFHASFWTLVKKRGFWLIFLFVGEFFATFALKHYQSTLEHVLILAIFVPLIISSGGNIGSQSVTLITRGLAVGDVRLADAARVIWREGLMGLILGGFLGIIGFLHAIVWGASPIIGLAVGLGVVGVVIVGSLAGSALPLLFKRLGFDPAIMSSPFVASLVDVIGIFIYFSVAHMLLLS